MKINEMPKVYRDYMNDEYSDDQHKLISVENALQHTQDETDLLALKSMKQILKRRITLSQKS